MSLAIRVSGADITDDVIIAEARFTMANGPNPGDFEFRVLDPTKSLTFRAGEPIEVDFDSVRVFEGYVLQAAGGHGFPVDDSVTVGPEAVERIWTLKGVDLNILFRKRVIFDQDNPHLTPDLELPAGTSDLTYLNQIVDHLTLGGDNLTFDFNAVGSPNPDRKGNALFTGDSWEKVMSLTATLPGAIWGIRPPRTVYYEDDDTETAPFAISDVPDNVTSFGYSNFDWLHDGSRLVNDARIWGVGLGQDHLSFAHVSDAASIAEHGRWQNGNGWRFNLYKQASVNAVANSLVYGSPQNLHGPKDDSMVVTCRIKRPGIMPGHKVRIISEVFGEEIVLPVRRYTITFVDRDNALFDLEMSWEIDAPLGLFDYPPFPDIDLPPPEITIPNPCDGFGFDSELGLLDTSFGWEAVRSHPWLGIASFGQNTFSFTPMKRYNQTHGIIFVADYGDGIAGSLTYVHARRHVIQPARWAIQVDFNVPSYSIAPGYHMAPFPHINGPGGLNWGAGDWTIYPKISLDLEAFGTKRRLVDVGAGINRVPALGEVNTHQEQGTGWHYELYSNGESRCWRHGDVRPASSAIIPNERAPQPTNEPWDQEAFGPNRPWRKALTLFDGSPDSTYETANYIYLRAQAGGDAGEKSAHPGTVVGNPFNGPFVSFTTGPTVSGNVSGYHEAINQSYSASMQINNFRFITLPDTFNFASDPIPECAELTAMPTAGAQNCEQLYRVNDTDFVTTRAFTAGSTTASLEGTEQRRGLDYDEDVANQKLIFREPILSSAGLWVCYQVVS